MCGSVSYVVDLQYVRRLGPHLLAQSGILGERLTVRRNHCLQSGRPSSFLEFFWETALNDLHHDPHGRGSARRSTQHRHDGTVGGADKLGAKFQNAAMGWILFDDLYALACDFDPPILLPGMWIELAERGEPLLSAFKHLADQICFEGQVIPADGQQRQEILRVDGEEEIEIGAMLEKLRRKARVWPEQQRHLAFDVARVEMRYRHRR